MRALILLAHGSRSLLMEQEVVDLARALNDEAAKRRVTHAFLDVLRPTLPEAVDRAAAGGAKQIDILPLFLHAGDHVQQDIPRMMDDARRRHPAVNIRLLRHLGAHPEIRLLVYDMAKDPDRYLADG